MAALKERHLYSLRPSRKRTVESAIQWFFRLATYLVILAAGYIFANIAWNGSKAVFTTKAPFINTDFLTQKPQTLHVYEPKGTVEEQAAISAEQIKLRRERNNLGSSDKEAALAINEELKNLQGRYDTLDIIRKDERQLYSDTEYRALETKPDPERFAYSNYAYSGGGIGPAIVGTTLLVLGSIAIALTLGVLCAVYLSEYSRPGRVLQTVRLSILNLSGVPSIVFGLFGFGMFVLFFGWGVSMLAGWFTLAIMALPVIITASEESMRAIPKGFREGSLALGASKWTAIRTNVLPYALPGILTSSIMGIARVAGETAPIMFTAAFALRDQLPWEGLSRWTDFFFQGVMALPYHIYVVSAKIPQNEYTRTMQYGAAFVFLVIVGFFALSSIILRIRIRKKYRW
ncbi:phosphate ABC transporter permease PtsA [Coraliomargarita sinensis]|uniref:Phosphate transport system permease protein PstA n=1 Tax=Coraliomargarita sinensis TaxID=2174842 RepID=A0A317ZIP3_9BACT|nr:phosphate ABC transporter permease PstA [Coraliomargarita sinensis]PXA03768.1 phosphate ABC transporter permease PtsA [Coraliomargarita sinensis]